MTIPVDYAPRGRLTLGHAPDRTAEPAGVPERASALPVADLVVPAPRPPSVTPDRFDPAAVATWERVQAQIEVATPDPDNFAGGQSWEFREPGPMATHRDMLVGTFTNRRGEVEALCQQSPPVHVKGSPFALPTSHKTIAREISEAHAQRLTLAREARAGSDGMSTGAVADALKMPRAAATRARMKKPRKARR